MFGTKLKTWMENHIGRQKRKSQPEKAKPDRNDGRGIILESSESLAQSDTGISSGSQQVLTSSLTDPREGGYCTTTLESEKSTMAHCITAVSLPSPESAYSTGYSTDGASPGGTVPPEYYINIRTGKHYFPSPAPTPTSPTQPVSFFPALQSGNSFYDSPSQVSNAPSSFGLIPVASRCQQMPPALYFRSGFSGHRPNGCPPVLSIFNSENLTSKTALPKKKLDSEFKTLSTSVPTHFDTFNSSKSPFKKSPQIKSQLSSLKLFLKSPKPDKRKEKENVEKEDMKKALEVENKKKILSPMKAKKWFKQPFQKFGQKRTGPTFESLGKLEAQKGDHPDKNIYYLTQENTISPRQRNRIKTNPWLPTEPISSQNFHSLQMNFSPSRLTSRNRSCTNTPLQNRKITNDVVKVDIEQTKLKEMNCRYEEPKDYLANSEALTTRHLGSGKLAPYMEISDHSEEDLTFNEMMGTYNESYVYEKETDILSDSDPTDCDDYVSDSEADNGGDEQDSHDDELDFIDNVSVTVEADKTLARNSGKCTYHEINFKRNSFLGKWERHHLKKETEQKKSLRKDKEGKGRKSKEEKKRRITRKSLKFDGEDLRKRPELGRLKPRIELDENVGGLNLSRVLMLRMMARNGSKSADGTPVFIRRRNLIKELRETHIDASQASQNETETGKQPVGLKSNNFFVDVEGDKKYKELITEAENMFQTMRNSPIVQNRRKLTISERPEKLTDSIKVWKKAERICEDENSVKNPDGETRAVVGGGTVRKSPKHLGLKLQVDDAPANLKSFEFTKGKKEGLRAKSSAHSPLDPLGPTFRNFSVFKSSDINDRKLSLSSSEESEPRNNQQHTDRTPIRPNNIPESPVVPFAFQSIDFGKPLMSYCPQSEPVKRKIYTCSKTYDRFMKNFENNVPPRVFEETANGPVRHESLLSRGHQEGMLPRFEKPRDSFSFQNVCNSPKMSSNRRSASNRPSFRNPRDNQTQCNETFR